MLTSSPRGAPAAQLVSYVGPKRPLSFVLVTALVSALVGSVAGLGLGIAGGFGELLSATTLGFVFGAFLGLIVGVLFRSMRKLRGLASGSRRRATLVFALLGAIPGALIFSLFSQGLTMMMFQAVMGGIVGALITGMTGIILGIGWRKPAV
jgi:hypothetical protein